MKALIIVPIIVGSALFVTGGAVMAVAIANNNNNLKVVNTYADLSSFSNINIDLDTADLQFEVAADGKPKVVCTEAKKQLHEVKSENNTLTIKAHDQRRWYEKVLNFSYFKRNIVIYMPAGTYTDAVIKASTGDINIPHDFSFNTLNVKTSTGDSRIKSDVATSTYVEASTGNVTLSEMSTKELNIKTSTGNIYLEKVNVETSVTVNASTGKVKTNELKAKNFSSNTSTGDVRMTNSIMEENIDIKTSTGDVNFDGADAATLHIKTSTGDVKGTLLTSKIFQAKSSTGKINVPTSTTGGLCEVETSTGDIVLSIKA